MNGPFIVLVVLAVSALTRADSADKTVCDRIAAVDCSFTCPSGEAPEPDPDSNFIACSKTRGNGKTETRCFNKKNGQCPSSWEPETTMSCFKCCCTCPTPYHRKFLECCDNMVEF